MQSISPINDYWEGKHLFSESIIKDFPSFINYCKKQNLSLEQTLIKPKVFRRLIEKFLGYNFDEDCAPESNVNNLFPDYYIKANNTKLFLAEVKGVNQKLSTNTEEANTLALDPDTPESQLKKYFEHLPEINYGIIFNLTSVIVFKAIRKNNQVHLEYLPEYSFECAKVFQRHKVHLTKVENFYQHFKKENFITDALKLQEIKLSDPGKDGQPLSSGYPVNKNYFCQGVRRNINLLALSIKEQFINAIEWATDLSYQYKNLEKSQFYSSLFKTITFHEKNLDTAFDSKVAQETFRELAYKMIVKILLLRCAEDRGLIKPVISNGRLYELLTISPDMNFDNVLDELDETGKKNLYYNFFKDNEYRYFFYRPDLMLNLFYHFNKFKFTDIDWDILGTLYESFVVDTYSQSKRGQYYTPKKLVDLMLDMIKISPSSINKDSPIIDFACGSGAFLAEALYRMINSFKEEKYIIKYDEAIDFIDNVKEAVLGSDIQSFPAYLTEASLLIQLLSILQPGMSIPYNFGISRVESLGVFGNNQAGDNNADLIKSKKGNVKYITMNPPYVSDWTREVEQLIKNNITISSREKKFLTYQVGDFFASSKPNIFYFFLALGIQYLKECGVGVFILPQEWLTARYSDSLRSYILNSCLIKQMILFNSKVDLFTARNDQTPLKTTSMIIILEKASGKENDYKRKTNIINILSLLSNDRRENETLDKYRDRILEEIKSSINDQDLVPDYFEIFNLQQDELSEKPWQIFNATDRQLTTAIANNCRATTKTLQKKIKISNKDSTGKTKVVWINANNYNIIDQWEVSEFKIPSKDLWQIHTSLFKFGMKFYYTQNEKFTSNSYVKLRDVANIRKGTEAGSPIFIIDNALFDNISWTDDEKKVIKKIIKNSNINKFELSPSTKYVINISGDLRNITEEEFKLKMPNIWSRLYPLKDELSNRNEDFRKGKSWWKLHRDRDGNYLGYRIVTPYREGPEGNFKFALDRCNLYNDSADVTFIEPYYKTNSIDTVIDIYYLMAILNSSITKYWYQIKGTQGGSGYMLRPTGLQYIPIKIPVSTYDKALSNYISYLVQKLVMLINPDKKTLESELNPKTSSKFLGFSGNGVRLGGTLITDATINGNTLILKMESPRMKINITCENHYVLYDLYNNIKTNLPKSWEWLLFNIKFINHKKYNGKPVKQYELYKKYYMWKIDKLVMQLYEMEDILT